MRQIKITSAITPRDSRALEKYLNEIGRTEMLTPDEEVQLAQTIREGGEKGKKALDRLVSANLRFVVSVAKQYQNNGLSLEDLVNEGNIGMITAAQRFDETRGFKFISYAVWWIRQSIMLALANQSRMVRSPQNRDGLASKIARASAAFEQRNMRRPSLDELADELEVTPDKIADAQSGSGRHISFDAPFADDEDGNLLDVLPNDNTPSTDSRLNQESLSTDLNQVLESLNPREREILKLSFGIGQPEMSLDEIGAQFDLSRERVRQIREKAIRRLRHQNNSQLRSYL